MAALNYLNNKRLRACSLKHFARRASQLGGAPTPGNASIGESIRPVMAPQGSKPLLPVRELRVLASFRLDSCRLLCHSRTYGDYCLKCHYVRISIIRKSIHTQQTPIDEEQTTDFLYKELLAAIRNDLGSNHQISDSFLNSNKICSSGNLSSASTLLGYLHGNEVFLSHNSYIDLLATASERNCVDLSTQIFKHLVVSSETLSSAAYLSIAKAFRESPDSTRLLSFIREVSELTSPRSIIILNRIILSFAESRQIDNALLIFDHMKSLSCKPDLITYNTVLDVLGRFGRVDDMFLELEKMKEGGVTPDIISYNTLLNTLRRMGKFDMCSRIKEEMDESRIEPDLLTYTALIEALGRSGNIEQSLGLFNEMKAREIRPSAYIYKSLVSNLKKMGKVELAMILVEEMESTRSELAGPGDFKRKKRR